MVLKIHGTSFSVATQTVLVTLKEINVPYEIVSVNPLKGEHKNTEYVATKHPFAQIPVLVSKPSLRHKHGIDVS